MCWHTAAMVLHVFSFKCPSRQSCFIQYNNGYHNDTLPSVFFPPILLLLDYKIHLWKAIPRLYHIFLKSLKRSSQMPPILPETKSRLGTYFQKSESILRHHSAGRTLLKGLNRELADRQAHDRARENKIGRAHV